MACWLGGSTRQQVCRYLNEAAAVQAIAMEPASRQPHISVSIRSQSIDMPSGSNQPQPPATSTAAPPMKHPPNVNPPAYCNGYVLGKTLGAGSYAKVKAAQCLKTKQRVAVKIISKKSAPGDFLTKFLPRELDALQAVEHQNVVKLHEVIHTKDHAYLVMDVAEKGDLLDYINSKRYLSEETARRLFTEFVNGMEKCHGVGVVHRDLKCENLLLDSETRLKIADFGFACKHEGKNLETYCGSFAYAAPEVILGEPYQGEKADIWSMGVILYAMAVGRLPFKDTDIKTMLSEIARRLVFPSRVSEDYKDLVRKILTFKPADRLSLEGIKAHPWMQGKTDESIL